MRVQNNPVTDTTRVIIDNKDMREKTLSRIVELIATRVADEWFNQNGPDMIRDIKADDIAKQAIDIILQHSKEILNNKSENAS